MKADERFMQMALRLAWRALGTTAENPPVGCVIVKENQVLGVGWTQKGGRPHAETEALAMAGDNARGATAYVTLEPCAHRGKTPPCAEAIVSKGIIRVVSALEDPDSRTSGKGFDILRRAGVAVEIGPCADEARAVTAGFMNRIGKNRPYVLLKLALSADGKIGLRGEETQITSEEARARVHLMRARSDLVLVGRVTDDGDNPGLSVRLPGLEDRSPIRAVIGSRPREGVKSTLWILPESYRTRPELDRIDYRIKGGTQADLGAVMEALAGRGINRVMVEGGAVLARSLLEAGLVDVMALFRSPKVIGPEGIDAFAGMLLDQVTAPFRVTGEERLGADSLTLYERRERT